MKIHVYGKAHIKGVSKKTGNPYDFCEVHYLGKQRGVIGSAACKILLDPNEHPFDDILVDCDYICEFDQRGYPVEFTPDL